MAILVVVPWAKKVAEIEGELTLTTSEIRSIYVRDQILTLYSFTSGKSIEKASLWETASANGKRRVHCTTLPQNSPERVSCFKDVLTNDWKFLTAEPVFNYFRPLARSASKFFLSGASANWHNLMKLEGKPQITVTWSKADQGDMLDPIYDIFASLDLTSTLVSILCIGFSVSLKILALVGVVGLIKRREYITLCILVGVILYFFCTTLFLGQSRYRVPTEPYIAILGSIGIAYFKQVAHFWRK